MDCCGAGSLVETLVEALMLALWVVAAALAGNVTALTTQVRHDPGRVA